MKNKYRNINYKGCTVRLKSYDADYLKERIDECDFISYNNIKEVLQEFINATEIKYFDDRHIHNLTNTILKEEIGRNKQTSLDTTTGAYDDSRVLSNVEIFISDGVDTVAGDEVVTVSYGKKKKMRRVDSPSDAAILNKNILIKNINRK